jgi:hypothetical protein
MILWNNKSAPFQGCGVVHSTWFSWAMWHMHAPTFNKWHKKNKKNKKKNKNKKVTLHILTHGAMKGCRFTSLAICINDKIRDIMKRNVTIRSEIWTTNIRSRGFQDIREWMTLWKLILWSLECTSYSSCDSYVTTPSRLARLLINSPFWLARMIQQDTSLVGTPKNSSMHRATFILL